MEIIGVDTGNKAMKTPGCEPFPTGLVRHGTTEPAIKGETMCYMGKYYSLNDSRTPYQQDKTKDDTYFLLTLIAVAKNLIKKYPNQKFYKYDVCLAMGLPPQHMSLKAKYDEYFGKSGKLINFMYKDIPIEITVKHVFVYPQGFSITAASEIQKEIKRYPRSYVVDIGGYTTDVIRFSGRGNTYAPDLSFCESYDRGVIELLSTVESELRVHCSLSVDDYMAEAILAGNNNMLVDENAVKIAKETADNYATALIRTISEKIKDDFKTSYFIFMGGGSAMMRESIERAIDTKNLFFLTDVTANAKGYEIMARAKLTMSGEI